MANGGKKGGFTLVELLIVIAIIGLLMAIMMPAVSMVFEMADMAQCQQNLAMLYKANAVWQSEAGYSRPVWGARWASKLSPYLEESMEVLTCPTAQAQDVQMGRTGYNPLLMADIAFDIYQGGTKGSPGAVFLHTLTLDSKWTRLTWKSDDRVFVEMEDCGVAGGVGGYDDIRFTVEFDNGHPAYVRWEQNESWSIHTLRFDLVVSGKVLVEDWTWCGLGVGDRVPIPKEVYTNSHYGLSRGTYEAHGLDETQIGTPEPGDFFFLDYPKPEADFNDEGREDDWLRYFVEDPDAWDATYNVQDDPMIRPKDFNALRHMGKANVLFSDGHVEALGIEDLTETDSRWRHGE